MFKPIQFLPLCGLLLLSNNTLARDCTHVAKIHLFDKIEHVSILRFEARFPEWASQENRYLCAGDAVIVPKAISKVIVGYHTNPPKQAKLTAGETYEVGELRGTCNTWCKWLAEIEDLYEQLTQMETSYMSDILVFGRGKDGQLKPIFMPLAAGEGIEYEFFLFAQAGNIPVFWHGGEPNYQLQVTDATGKVVIDEKTVKTNRYDLKLPSTAQGQRYELTINNVYKKILVFVAPPPLAFDIQGDNPLKALMGLLLDDEKNWRLEIWRQLAKMPPTPERDEFQQHLKWDDF